MSRSKLDQVLKTLPGRRGPEALKSVSEALGPNVGRAEAERLGALIDAEWRSFEPAERRALEVLAGRAAPDLGPQVFKVTARLKTAIAEQSALTFVSPEHGFIAVDDETGTIHHFDLPAKKPPAGPLKTSVWGKSKLMKGMEGAYFDPASSRLWTLSENTRAVFTTSLDLSANPPALGETKQVGTLPEVGTTKNKGWEGIAVLPGAFTPDHQPRLLTAHEAEPCGVGVFRPDTLELECFVPLPRSMEKVTDLSDLTVDLHTGRLFLLSDERQAFFEVELRPTPKQLGRSPLPGAWHVVLVGETSLPAKSNLQAEGLAFDHRGDLWVSGEKGTILLHLLRQ